MFSKLRELHQYRELLLNLVKKELKVKYRNSVLGFFWSLLNPLLMMIVFTFFIGQVFRPGIKDFPIFLLIGILPWNFFNGSLQTATSSIIGNSNLIKKVYFPREILPISAVLANLINFLLEVLVLFAFLIVYGYNFYPYIPVLLVLVVIEAILIIGISLTLSGLNVYFRDIQYILSVLLLALFYSTPILYTIKMVESIGFVQRHPYLLYLYKANPLAALIIQYQHILYEGNLPSLKLFLYVVIISVTLLLLGYLIFHKLEPSFAEEV